MTFSDVQLQTLRAMIDRLIPADDFPGALAAGTDNYVLHQLDHDAKDDRSMIEAGLAALAELSFATLDADRQDAILRQFESGPHSNFFNKMVHLTGEGFYADPGNGGNRDAVSWAMIGFQSTGGKRTIP